MRKNVKKVVIAFVVGVFSIFSLGAVVQAEDYENGNESPVWSSNVVHTDENGAVVLDWFYVPPTVDGVQPTVSYEIQFDDEKKFVDATTFTTAENIYTLTKKQFGKNGGRRYVRLRSVLTDASGVVTYSEYSKVREVVYVKINKTNFPGLYKLLKNGGQYTSLDGIEKIVYDTDGDGWMNPDECQSVFMISTEDTYKKKNGKNVLIKATDVSSMTGIAYFPNVTSVSLDRYSGAKMDLSKNRVNSVNVRGIKTKTFTLIAPIAQTVLLEGDYEAKITKLDISKCNKAVDVWLYGSNGTKTLKLPSNKKNLKVLSISDCSLSTLNVNAYTNLQQLYLYKTSLKGLKVNKCKNLRYLYFYYCEKIKSVDVSANKKLRGMDIYKTKSLKKNNVKKYKKTKLTVDKGKWWYDTDAYKEDMKHLYD